MSLLNLMERLPKKTWPYGTRKPVKVIESHPNCKLPGGKKCRVLLCAELPEQREAHLIVGDGGDPAAAGDVGTIVFCRGGATGGYWRYSATV